MGRARTNARKQTHARKRTRTRAAATRPRWPSLRYASTPYRATQSLRFSVSAGTGIPHGTVSSTVTVATVRGAHRYAKAIYKQGGTQKPLEETLSRELTAEECKGVHMPERALSVVLEPIDAPIRNDESHSRRTAAWEYCSSTNCVICRSLCVAALSVRRVRFGHA